MKSLKEYIDEGLLDRVKNKEVNHEAVIIEFLEKNYNIQSSYTIKETKTGIMIDVKSDIEVKNHNITSLTNGLFEFGKVNKSFDCAGCKSLKSLEGAPKAVGGYFNCSYCDSLKSLEGAPKKVKRDFGCYSCKSLKSLEGAPKAVGGSFYCQNCDNLKSLEGAPKEVGKDFDCKKCESLKTLEGAPKEVSGYFNCSYCDSLKSLEGAPEEVGGNFHCINYSTQFTEDDVRKHTTVAKKIYIK